MEVVVLVTTSNKIQAQRIATCLIEKKLSACVNIIKDIHSLFRWQGRLTRSREYLLIIKTKKGCLERLIREVKSLHSYEVPEIIALPIIAGEPKFISWLRKETQG